MKAPSGAFLLSF
ncbi:hypothetical protein MLW68_021760 [Escherichia coli]|nr:hypothetical protein [Escherichia coli]MCV1772591.1 hypothetical protein [Escherichia coli]